jgi:hypothetical protein
MVIEIAAQEHDGSDKRGQHAKPVRVLVFILDEPKTRQKKQPAQAV